METLIESLTVTGISYGGHEGVLTLARIQSRMLHHDGNIRLKKTCIGRSERDGLRIV